jgi:Immunity protein Imm1
MTAGSCLGTGRTEMPVVRRVNDCFHPTWEETQPLLLGLRDRPATQVSLEVDDEVFFVIEYVQGAGYFMSGCGPSDREYFNLVESSLGDEVTPGALAHENRSFPRYALVGAETLLRAARTFFETGQRDPTCEWVPERDAFYD